MSSVAFSLNCHAMLGDCTAHGKTRKEKMEEFVQKHRKFFEKFGENI
ncbi:MAG: hypothetical protein HYW27_00250 [Candidatus Aenigmarchaeota archaeon]|nr:hypothetical protein [Candidatus Aenigmarchaeota archaeon]